VCSFSDRLFTSLLWSPHWSDCFLAFCRQFLFSLRSRVLSQSEVPYSCEVVIESFTDKDDGLSVIEADIVASRRSQKAILIGQGGSKIKELGIMARERLEKV
jgi:hypothetical protein